MMVRRGLIVVEGTMTGCDMGPFLNDFCMEMVLIILMLVSIQSYYIFISLNVKSRMDAKALVG